VRSRRALEAKTCGDARTPRLSVPTVPAGDHPDSRRTLGRAGEELAAEHLERRGFALLARNHQTRWGELDIIAFDGETLVFCEVKTRRGAAGGRSPLESITPAKARRIRRMAAAWLAATRDRPRAADLRFDAVAVSFDAAGRLQALEHLEGCF
jgi:putative endonuclease